jgi:cytochrome c oxidase subunit II
MTRRLLPPVGLVLVLASCGSKQSTLDPVSGPAREIEHLWWIMMSGAWVVFGGALAFLVIGWLRRRDAGWPLLGQREGLNVGLVVGFGLVVPLAVLSALFVYANVHVMSATSAPTRGSTQLAVDVVGHQWFWEVRYPGTTAVTANEIHIPVGTRVAVEVTTADVMHSFWVPRLNRKIDLVPGRLNEVLLYAERAGVYRGQCSEFCGLQHAHMALLVVAQPPAEFRGWLQAQARPGRAPTDPNERRGEDLFLTESCAGCHTIRGTEAAGDIGPDLTHVGGRSTIAAVTLPNRPDALAEWIRDPQHVKPGVKMPALGLGDGEVQALVAYLESLR